uniref:Uncharacterized protein n=1 Tax=Lepeophtheirus salmonis TaxID=72036 RepID=A0A0K2UFN1_LEPSM
MTESQIKHYFPMPTRFQKNTGFSDSD